MQSPHIFPLPDPAIIYLTTSCRDIWAVFSFSLWSAMLCVHISVPLAIMKLLLKRVAIASTCVWEGSVSTFSLKPNKVFSSLSVWQEEKLPLQRCFLCLFVAFTFWHVRLIYVFVYSCLSLCFYLNPLPYFCVPDKTPPRHLEQNWTHVCLYRPEALLVPVRACNAGLPCAWVLFPHWPLSERNGSSSGWYYIFFHFKCSLHVVSWLAYWLFLFLLF